MGDAYQEHFYALIICGGAGTRLWPRSREKTPKQFLEKFYGESTLFSQTYKRARLLTSPDKIYIVTLSDYIDEILDQDKEIFPQNIIPEPFGRNTAMAVGIGAAFIKKKDPEAVIVNFWSDAAIENNEKFVQNLRTAAKFAHENKDKLVVIGLKPTFPHTGLGYIETKELFTEDIYKVASFKEKPDLKTATEFLNKGNYFWNTGIYVWSVPAIFSSFSKHSPSLYSLLDEIFVNLNTTNQSSAIQKAYEKAENISIDVAVSEKAENLYMVLGEFGWSDIGDWKIAYELKEKNKDGNVIEIFGKKGQHFGIETRNCLIEVQDRLVTTVGVENLIIVETQDAVLVCAKEKSQDVKKIVAQLKELGKKEYL